MKTETFLLEQSMQDAMYKKINWRVLLFFVVCYLFAYLDRINIGFAKLQMQQDIGINDAVYGLAAGMFFLGYVLFEVPSNLMLPRVATTASRPVIIADTQDNPGVGGDSNTTGILRALLKLGAQDAAIGLICDPAAAAAAHAAGVGASINIGLGGCP